MHNYCFLGNVCANCISRLFTQLCNQTVCLPITALNLVSYLKCRIEVFSLWTAWMWLFSESPGADRAGNMVVIALGCCYLGQQEEVSVCPAFCFPGLICLWSLSQQSSCISFLPCPNGHRMTFYLTIPSITRSARGLLESLCTPHMVSSSVCILLMLFQSCVLLLFIVYTE